MLYDVSIIAIKQEDCYDTHADIIFFFLSMKYLCMYKCKDILLMHTLQVCNLKQNISNITKISDTEVVL